MPDPNDDPSMERELWRRWRSASPSPPRRRTQRGCPEAMSLAAYVDGRLNDSQRDRLESHLADCPQCLVCVREARALLASVEEASKAPAARLAARAKALVPPDAKRRKAGAWLGLATGRGRWQVAARWAAAAAAAVVVGIAGFLAGSATYRNQQRWEDRVVAEVSFELTDAADDRLAEDDAFELLLQRSGGAK